MDFQTWIEWFKSAADTKTALVVALGGGLWLGIWIRGFLSKFLTKESFFKILDGLQETVEGNTAKALSMAKEASTSCREETRNVMLSLKGHNEQVNALAQEVSKLTGQVGAYTDTVQAYIKKNGG